MSVGKCVWQEAWPWSCLGHNITAHSPGLGGLTLHLWNRLCSPWIPRATGLTLSPALHWCWGWPVVSTQHACVHHWGAAGVGRILGLQNQKFAPQCCNTMTNIPVFLTSLWITHLLLFIVCTRELEFAVLFLWKCTHWFLWARFFIFLTWVLSLFLFL